jgi:hypothetical protein
MNLTEQILPRAAQNLHGLSCLRAIPSRQFIHFIYAGEPLIEKYQLSDVDIVNYCIKPTS